MAKRTSGASEVNGFISIVPEKTTKEKTSKTLPSKTVTKPAPKARQEVKKPPVSIRKDAKPPEATTKERQVAAKPKLSRDAVLRTTGDKEKKIAKPSPPLRKDLKESTSGKTSKTEKKITTLTEKKNLIKKPILNPSKPVVSNKPRLHSNAAGTQSQGRKGPLKSTPAATQKIIKNEPSKNKIQIKNDLPDKKNSKETTEPIVPVRQRTWVKEDEASPERIEATVSKEISTVKADKYQVEEPLPVPVSVSESLQLEPLDDYEDDFEDYESDFEEYVSESGVSDTTSAKTDHSITSISSESSNQSLENGLSENSKVSEFKHEEKKMDSGNYDLHKSRVIDLPLPSPVKELEESSLPSPKSARLPQGPSEDDLVDHILGIKKIDDKKPPTPSPTPAVKETKQVKKKSLAQIRGEKLKQMIKLDTVTINLLEMAPIPYDIFIKIYGNQNSSQASTQTNEDNLDQEIQTEEIEHEEKWTQHPVKFHGWEKSIDKSLRMFFHDRKGVGNDKLAKVEITNVKSYSLTKLKKFLFYSADIMTTLLEEDGCVQKGENVRKNKTEIGFSDGYILITGHQIPCLSRRDVLIVLFSPHNANIMVTVLQEAPFTNKSVIDDLGRRCLICVWNILEPNSPRKILVASSQVSCICFDLIHSHLLFGGHKDGSISVWDLNERDSLHSLAHGPDLKNIIRTPTYSTAQVIGDNGHVESVLSIHSMTYKQSGANSDFSSPQTVSLDEGGNLILWTGVQNREKNRTVRCTFN